MAEVSGEGGVGLSMELISGETSGNASPLTVSASFEDGGKGSSSRRRQSVRPNLDADEFINLLHGSDPVKLELNRLENEIRDKDRELGEARSQIKALKLSESLREKAGEELTEGLRKVEEKLKLTETLLESKNLEIKRLNEEKKASMAAQLTAVAILSRVHSAQKDDNIPPYFPHMPPYYPNYPHSPPFLSSPYYPDYPPSGQNPPFLPPPYYPNYPPAGQNPSFLPPPYYLNYPPSNQNPPFAPQPYYQNYPQPMQQPTPSDAKSQPSQCSESVSDTELPHLQQVSQVQQPPQRQCQAKKILWSMDEEEAFMAAYVEVSLDPVICNNQRSSAFWGRVAECLERHNPSGHHRTRQQCKSHWHMVKRPIRAFSEKFNEVYKEHHSEWNDEEIIGEAHRRYIDANGQKRFTYMHMWHKIRDQPKRAPISTREQPTKKTRNNESGAYTLSSGPDMPISVDGVQPEVRQIGQKATSRKSKPKGFGSTSHKPKLYEADQKKTELERLKNWPNLYEILLMPTNGMSPEQLVMHEKMCAKVRQTLGLD